MRDLFGVKGVLYWWGFFTAFIFLEDVARQVEESLRKATFVQEDVLYKMLSAVDQSIERVVDAVFHAIKFNPDAPFISGAMVIQNRHIVAMIGLVVLLLVIGGFYRAIKSRAFLDDFAVLCVFYLLLQFELDLGRNIGWRDLAEVLQKREVLLVIIAGIIIFFAIRSRAIEDSKIFWRGVLEVLVVSFVFLPQPTAMKLADVLDLCIGIGKALGASPLLGAWAGLGLGLSVWHLYIVGERKRKPTGEVLEKLREEMNKAIDKAKKEE